MVLSLDSNPDETLDAILQSGLKPAFDFSNGWRPSRAHSRVEADGV
jgi:hypothetical protein